MTEPELPDFEPILREINTVIGALMAASSARVQRGQQREAMQVVIVADALDMARGMINDLRGTTAYHHEAPPGPSISLN